MLHSLIEPKLAASMTYSATYDKVSIFFNFDTDGATAGEKTYFFDDVGIASGP